MQATMTSNAPALPLRLQFARRGYMVRSEKRPSPAPQRSPEQSGGRKPKRRPPRAGFFYKLLTTLLLVLIWPVGMVLLWRRKLKWSTLMKLFTSVLTLMVCILLLGTALTVETGNPRISAAQDSVIRFMDGMIEEISDFSVRMGERAQLSLEALDDITEVYRDQLLMKAADAIDWGVEKAQSLRESFLGQSSDSGGQGDVEEPAQTGEAGIASSPEPEADEASAAQTASPEEGEATAAPKRPSATSVPPAELSVGAQDDKLPVYIPASAPDLQDGVALREGTLQRSGLLKSDLPDGAEATPEAEAEPLEFAVKPAGKATVYFNAGTGKYYHTRSACGSMKTATAYDFAETAEYNHKPCNTCGAPDKALLDEEYVAWVDEDGLAHLSDECPAFQGQWSLESAEEANAAGREGCAECGADRYLAALANGEEVALISESEDEDEAAAEAGAEATGEPEEGVKEAEATDAPAEVEEAKAEESPEPADEPAEESLDEAAEEPTEEPSAEPSAESAEEPGDSLEPEASPETSPEASATAEPSPEATQGLMVVTPRSTLKPAETTVYHTEHGKYYHTQERCSGMLGAKAYTVSESAEAGFDPCPVCGAPPAGADSEGALLLWRDEKDVCHVSDECKDFEGQYALISRDEALSQGLSGCERCGGADYLIPGTVMDPYVVGAPAPSASPEAEADAGAEAA